MSEDGVAMWAVIATDDHPRTADSEPFYGSVLIVGLGTTVLIEPHSVRVNGVEVLRRIEGPPLPVPHNWSSRHPEGWGVTTWTGFKIEEVQS